MFAVGLNSSALMMMVPRPFPAEPIPTVVKTPEPVVKVSALVAPLITPPKFKARLAVLEPPEVLIDVAAARLMGVPASPMVVAPLLIIVPAKVTLLGIVAVKPALKVLELDALPPICRVPVFAKVVASVIVLVPPVMLRLYDPDPVLRALTCKLLLIETAPLCPLLILSEMGFEFDNSIIPLKLQPLQSSQLGVPPG